MKVLNKKVLYDALQLLKESYEVYAPVKEDTVNFKVWEQGMEITLDEMSVKSCKDAFFPQKEDLAYFKMEGKAISIKAMEYSSQDTIYFGVRGCDAKSFEILDSIFLSEPKDMYYASRREHATIISLACIHPESSCFCKVFDIDPANPSGDVVIYPSGDVLYLKAQSEKGDAALEKITSLCEDVCEDVLEEIQSKIHQKVEKLPFMNLSLDEFDKEHMQDLFEHPSWEDLSKACLGCGSCTFICPTCQCYDIREYDNGKGIQRYRCWDSCMYHDFTMMAHGTPRPTQKERFRQRFMHKLVYHPSNHDGVYACVGCGRCVKKCPINMNIIKVIQTLKGGMNE